MGEGSEGRIETKPFVKINPTKKFQLEVFRAKKVQLMITFQLF